MAIYTIHGNKYNVKVNKEISPLDEIKCVTLAKSIYDQMTTDETGTPDVLIPDICHLAMAITYTDMTTDGHETDELLALTRKEPFMETIRKALDSEFGDGFGMLIEDRLLEQMKVVAYRPPMDVLAERILGMWKLFEDEAVKALIAATT